MYITLTKNTDEENPEILRQQKNLEQPNQDRGHYRKNGQTRGVETPF